MPEFDRFWTKSYPAGVPAEVDLSAFDSLVDFMQHACESGGARPAFSCLDSTISYAQLWSLSARYADFFCRHWLLKPGDRIALMLPNVLQYPVLLLAALRAGLVVVNVNPLYTPRELKHQLNDSQARAIVVLDQFAPVVAEVMPHVTTEHTMVTRVGDLLGWRGPLVNFVLRYIKRTLKPWRIPGVAMFHAVPKNSKKTDWPVIKKEQLAFLQYTGGTTGIPKAAMLTHANVLANALQLVSWAKIDVRSKKEVIIQPLPLYHIYSLTVTLTFMFFSAQTILVPNPRDRDGFVKLLKKQTGTIFIGLNTLFNALLDHKKFAEINFKALRVTLSGGMATQAAVAARWEKITGVPVCQGYGLTETSPVVSVNRLHGEAYDGTVGLPLPGTDVCIKNEVGDQQPMGEIGELCVRGPQVMRGYWHRPDETAAVLQNDWLSTGDMATLDEKGRIHLVERKKDLIIVSGFNVYPNEVEAVLAQHPKVLEAAVVGEQVSSTGEQVVAFIVPRGDAPSVNDLLTFCRQQLTAYKVPKKIVFRQSLPKTPVGKVLRRALLTAPDKEASDIKTG